jgi:hypothetical protein
MICIGFYCDIEPTNKIVVPRLVRTTLSKVLYETDVCMKLFNIASPSLTSEVGQTYNRSRLLMGYVR